MFLLLMSVRSNLESQILGLYNTYTCYIQKFQDSR